MNDARVFRVMFIDGHDLKFKQFETRAVDNEDAIRKLRETYTEGDFDHQIESVTDVTEEWKTQYWNNGEQWHRHIDPSEYYDSQGEKSQFEIIFERDGVRRYCFVYASSMDEALGSFFRHHHDVTYYEIVDHIET